MNNPLTKEQNVAIRRVAKFLMCCGFAPKTAHDIARAEVLAHLIANLKEA